MSFLMAVWQSKKGRLSIIVVVLILISAVSYLVYDQVGGGAWGISEPEKTAVAYYKAVWVEGNPQRAKNLLSSKYRDNYLTLAALEVNCDSAKENPAPKSPVLIVEDPNPMDKKNDHKKIFYLYQPKQEKTMAILLDDLDGKWKVEYGTAATHYEDTYDGLNNQYPDLVRKWKEVPLP